MCHDDELEGRRIAYIFYLVPKDWTANDGGIVVLISQKCTVHDRHSFISSFCNQNFSVINGYNVSLRRSVLYLKFKEV